MCDSATAIQFVQDSKIYKKTRHIKRYYRFVQDTTKGKEVAIKHISNSKMIAYPLTKLIPRDTFKTYRVSLGLHRV